MIREVESHEQGELREFLERDILRNYFILLGVASSKEVYEKIYGQWKDGKLLAALFKRKSDNLQFYGEEGFDLEGFTKLIDEMEFKTLIGPRSFCDKFKARGVFSSFSEGAYLSGLESDSSLEDVDKGNTFHLELEDLDEVVEIYKSVFTSFASKETMIERLETNRGRGICIKEEGKILSLAQSDFEIEDGAIVVGVATRPELQGKGLASKVLKVLCQELLAEGKDLFLQYDNLEAGKIYERLGFKIIDQVYHYKK